MINLECLDITVNVHLSLRDHTASLINIAVACLSDIFRSAKRACTQKLNILGHTWFLLTAHLQWSREIIDLAVSVCLSACLPSATKSCRFPENVWCTQYNCIKIKYVLCMFYFVCNTSNMLEVQHTSLEAANNQTTLKHACSWAVLVIRTLIMMIDLINKCLESLCLSFDIQGCYLQYWGKVIFLSVS